MNYGLLDVSDFLTNLEFGILRSCKWRVLFVGKKNEEELKHVERK